VSIKPPLKKKTAQLRNKRVKKDLLPAAGKASSMGIISKAMYSVGRLSY
jgi:hypothetical protein